MGWSINYNSVYGIIEIKYFDVVSGDDLQKAFGAAVGLSAEHKTALVLSDCTQMKSGHTLFDLFNLIEELEISDSLRRLKEAVIMSGSAETAENVKFWETACTNRGFNVRIFENAENGINWLVSKF